MAEIRFEKAKKRFKDRNVAMVFQSYALYPHMTVYENLAFPLKMKKMQKEFVDKEVTGIAALLKQGVHEVSYG